MYYYCSSSHTNNFLTNHKILTSLFGTLLDIPKNLVTMTCPIFCCFTITYRPLEISNVLYPELLESLSQKGNT